MTEQTTETEQLEQAEELTPDQLVKRAISRAKREKWASILLANAIDKTSLRLAERLIKDWFGDGFDDQLREIGTR